MKNIFTLKSILFISLIILFSCNSQDEINEISDPLNSLIWLKNIKEEFESSDSTIKKEILQYNYNGNIVFSINPCKSCADGLVTIYNYDGEKICEFGGIDGKNTCPDFESEAKNKKILWKN